MKTKTFRSFEHIDNEIAILDLERQINYQKIVLSIQRTKEQLTIKNILENSFNSLKNTFSGSYSTVYKFAIPIVIKWLLNKKRSH